VTPPIRLVCDGAALLMQTMEGKGEEDGMFGVVWWKRVEEGQACLN